MRSTLSTVNADLIGVVHARSVVLVFALQQKGTYRSILISVGRKSQARNKSYAYECSIQLSRFSIVSVSLARNGSIELKERCRAYDRRYVECEFRAPVFAQAFRRNFPPVYAFYAFDAA